MSIIKICENVVPGAETTFIEVDTESVEEYYTVQYGGGGMTLPKGKEGKNMAIQEYLNNIRDQLLSISLSGDIIV